MFGILHFIEALKQGFKQIMIDLSQARALLADITTGLNTVSQNVTALQAAAQASNSAADQAAVNDLTNQIAALKQQVDTLATASTPPATPPQS